MPIALQDQLVFLLLGPPGCRQIDGVIVGITGQWHHGWGMDEIYSNWIIVAMYLRACKMDAWSKFFSLF